MKEIAQALLNAADALEKVSAKYSENAIKTMFERAARKVWGDEAIDQLTFKYNFNFEDDNALARMVWMNTGMRQHAKGNTLIHMPRNRVYTLEVSPRLLEKSAKAIERVLTHEAIHIGYPHHDKDFYKLVKKYKAAKTEMDADGLVALQELQNRKYKTIKEFKTREEAHSWGQVLLQNNPNKKYRVLSSVL